MKKLFKVLFCIFSIILIVNLTSCSKEELQFEEMANHKNVVESSQYGKIDMSFDELDGKDIRTFKTKVDKEYEFEYKYKIDSGELLIEFTDSKGNILAKLPDGNELKKEDSHIKIGEVGGVIKVTSADEKIKIIINGKKASGYININW